jgi:hypothetical protein
MAAASYTVVRKDDGWGVAHDGAVGQAYATKEAAFEAAVAAASMSLRDGYDIQITVPGRANENRD